MSSSAGQGNWLLMMGRHWRLGGTKWRKGISFTGLVVKICLLIVKILATCTRWFGQLLFCKKFVTHIQCQVTLPESRSNNLYTKQCSQLHVNDTWISWTVPLKSFCSCIKTTYIVTKVHWNSSNTLGPACKRIGVDSSIIWVGYVEFLKTHSEHNYKLLGFLVMFLAPLQS